MQLKAIDKNYNSIFASQAEKRKKYYCPECGYTVMLRSGPLRQAHFFHLKRKVSCKQSTKSPEHIYTQLFIQNNTYSEDCVLEEPFPDIGRVADCYIPSKKIIIEVQCSPISVEEVKNRNFDYNSLGLHVIWILHDKTFNQRRLSPVEIYLESSPTALYYTNISSADEGVIYDQVTLQRFRVKRKAFIQAFSGKINFSFSSYPYLSKIAMWNIPILRNIPFYSQGLYYLNLLREKNSLHLDKRAYLKACRISQDITDSYLLHLQHDCKRKVGIILNWERRLNDDEFTKKYRGKPNALLFYVLWTTLSYPLRFAIQYAKEYWLFRKKFRR